MSKVQIITKDPFDIIVSAVKKAGALVRPTYGPASNKVIIGKQLYRMVVDDGVQIMRDLELPDPAENEVLKVIRETAVKTNDRVGDGTTGSMIILQELMSGVADMTKRDGHKIERELKKAAKEAVAQLRKGAKKVTTKDDLLKVARVSYDNPEVAAIIADTWHRVGAEGDVTLEESPLPVTSADLADGLKIHKGYISPFMVTNPQRMEAAIEKPLFLITDYRLTNSEDVLGVLNKLAAAGRNKLVIIAEHVEDAALATLVINLPQVMNPHTGRPGVVQTVAISAPQSDNMQVTLADLALLTGARFFSQKKGDRLDTCEITDLGKADRFVAGRNDSLIVRPRGNSQLVKKAVADLRVAVAETTDENERKSLRRRLGMFTNQIAVIKVGADTDNERKAKKYKVEDAVASVKAAYKGGVVPGGGIALSQIKTSSDLLNRALEKPHKQLLENMGIDKAPDVKKGDALNVVTGEVGPWMKVGVLDPVDVLIAGIESAVSIACLLVTVSGMIVETPPEPKRE